MVAAEGCGDAHANQQACPQLAERTRYNRLKRWGEAGMSTRMMEGLAMAAATTFMLDTTDPRAQRTASNLQKNCRTWQPHRRTRGA